jgi:hypothetical protein
MRITIAPQIVTKLRGKHGVRPYEIHECFLNRVGKFLEDTRERHRTRPPTQWFIAETDVGRSLKVVFIEDVQNGQIHIKTAYEPDEAEERIYEKYGL